MRSIKFTYSLLLFLSITNVLIAQNSKPNVILIITDDQGYGDVGVHGINTLIHLIYTNYMGKAHV